MGDRCCSRACVDPAAGRFPPLALRPILAPLRTCPQLPAPLLPTPPPNAEENLDDAAAEGAVGVVVPLLKTLNGGDMLAQEQPTTRCV